MYYQIRNYSNVSVKNLWQRDIICALIFILNSRNQLPFQKCFEYLFEHRWSDNQGIFYPGFMSFSELDSNPRVQSLGWAPIWVPWQEPIFNSSALCSAWESWQIFLFTVVFRTPSEELIPGLFASQWNPMEGSPANQRFLFLFFASFF